MGKTIFFSGKPVTLFTSSLAAEYASYSENGQAALIQLLLAAANGSYTLTGQDIELILGGGITGYGNLEIIKAERLKTSIPAAIENISAQYLKTIGAAELETIKAPAIDR